MTTQAQDHAALEAAQQHKRSVALEDASDALEKLGDALALISMGDVIDQDITDAGFHYRALRRALKTIGHDGRWNS